MKITRKSVLSVVELVMDGSKQATLILDAKTKVTATRKGKLDRRDRRFHILLTYGSLNYRERNHVKRCTAKGKSFKSIIIK